ncbi:MAG: hypothetical protein ACI8RZ_001996 [Myxococcota bacterium]|jgi:hypothetical protein
MVTVCKLAARITRKYLKLRNAAAKTPQADQLLEERIYHKLPN